MRARISIEHRDHLVRTSVYSFDYRYISSQSSNRDLTTRARNFGAGNVTVDANVELDMLLCIVAHFGYSMFQSL